jgi:acylphosphatase
MTDIGASVRARILVSGRVQGVGYRAFTCRVAVARGLTGGVENLDSGQVAVDVEGGRRVIEEFLADLKKGPVGARVTQVQVEWGNATGRYHEFTIR